MQADSVKEIYSKIDKYLDASHWTWGATSMPTCAILKSWLDLLTLTIWLSLKSSYTLL